MQSSKGPNEVRAQRRAVAVALTLILVTPVGFLLALVFQWPSDFVLDESAVDDRVTMADIQNGTVTSMPLPPFVVLILATVAAKSRRWWGTAGLVGLAILGIVFAIGGLGEVMSDNPNVVETVLVIAGSVYIIAGMLLCGTALAALRERLRRGRRTAGR